MSGIYYSLSLFAPTVAHVEKHYTDLIVCEATFVQRVTSCAGLTENAYRQHWRIGQLYTAIEQVFESSIDEWDEQPTISREQLNTRAIMIRDLQALNTTLRREAVADPYRLVNKDDVFNVQVQLELWLYEGMFKLRDWAFAAVFDTREELAAIRSLTSDVFMAFNVAHRVNNGMVTYLVACCRVLNLVSQIRPYHILSTQERVAQIDKIIKKETACE